MKPISGLAHIPDVSVPVLDLAPLLAGGDVLELTEDLKHACLDTGFFYVFNHGVSQRLIDDLFDTAKSYFLRPIEERQLDLMDNRYRRGYAPFGTSKHPGFEADLKEAFTWGFDCPLSDKYVLEGKPLYGPNKWPTALPKLQHSAEACSEAFSSLGRRILEIVALSLDLSRDHFQNMFDKPCTTNRVVHYPPQTVMMDGQFGATQHTDFDLLTVLAQDPIGGLEIKKRSGEWIAAPYIPGTLVINIGDLCQMWTNDIYTSTMHRVINRTGRERFSAVTFLYPNFDILVEALPSCVNTMQPAKYAPIKAGDYLLEQLRKIQGYKPEGSPNALAEVAPFDQKAES